jgi:hypothetical protein
VRADEIRAIARKKQETLRALVGITTWECISDPGRESPFCDVYMLLSGDGDEPTISYRVRFNSAACSLVGFDTKNRGMTRQELLGGNFENHTLIAEHNAEITEPLMQPTFVFGEWYEKRLQAAYNANASEVLKTQPQNSFTNVPRPAYESPSSKA